MIVKCIKVISPSTGEDLGEKSPWLIRGKTYVVLAIRYTPRSVDCADGIEVLLESEDDRDPGCFDINQFEIISNKISSYWVCAKDEAKCLCFMPQEWFKEGFWEDMDNGDESAFAPYRKYRDLMIQEEPIRGIMKAI